MKSVALHNLGCKVNAYEFDAMQQMLQEKGYKIVPFDEVADIYIINTCSVTNIADRKSRQMLHRAKKRNPRAVVVAAGCYVQTGGDALEKDACIDLVVGNNKKKELVSILEAFFRERENGQAKKVWNRAVIPDMGGLLEYEEMTLAHTAEHTRAYIKIQDGCNQFCSYCIIPYARGRVRSRKEKDILREVEGLVQAGYQEIVLTGIHLSSYGMDFVMRAESDYLKDVREEAYRQGFLLHLLEKLQAVEGLRRIRLGSLEPRIITEELAGRLYELDKICPHFHLSLQSGCNDTLKRMNRHYLAGEYYEKVAILRRVFEQPAITTDVIVGFPGETDREFEETKRFLEKTGFYEMHVFKYSRRKGTAADSMDGQVAEEVKAWRSSELLRLEQEQSRRFRAGFLGREVEVLLEEQKEIDGKSYMTGHTAEYIKAAVETAGRKENQIYRGKVKGFLSDTLLVLE